MAVDNSTATDTKCIRVLQVGIGPLGVKISDFIGQRSALQTIAAVDKAPALAGRDLGEVCGAGRSGVIIRENIAQAIEAQRPDVAVLTTISDMARITPQIEEIVAHGIPVVSTCEELSFPYESAPGLAKRIDEAATRHEVAVIGTGVNPGFLMDALPTFLSAVCQAVEKIEVNRFQDARHRRIPFQRKIGAGLNLEEFDRKVKDGSLRHVGLTESMQLIAHRMGWALDRTEDIVSPVIATEPMVTPVMTVPEGFATGVRQIGNGYVGGEIKVKLVFQATVGEHKSYDEIIITGNPNLHSLIDGGVNGDVATCAITLNTIAQILRATPGLKTMVDIAPVSCF